MTGPAARVIRTRATPGAGSAQVSVSAVDQDSLLQFPCSFPIKAFGANARDFAALVLAIVHRHVDAEAIDDVHTRDSRNGRYLSVTVTIRADSRAQLDAIYRDLSGHDRVVMVL